MVAIALIKAEVQTLLQQHTAYRHYDVFVSAMVGSGGSDVNSVAAGAGVRFARLCVNRLWPCR